MAVTNPLPTAPKSTGIANPLPVRGFAGARKKIKSLPQDGGVEGFKSVTDAAAFGLKLGALDTMRGAIQFIPGDLGEANMARDQKRLNAAIEKYGMPVITAYGAGLIADPVGWALPISKLRVPAKLLKLAGAAKARKVAGDVAQVGAYGAGVGALSYVDEDAQSLLGEGEMTRGEQALIGGVAGPVMLAAGKGVSKLWRPKGYDIKSWTQQGKSRGDKAWEYLSQPGPSGAMVGGGLGGFAGAKSGLDPDADTPQTLQDMFGEDFLNGGDYAKWRNGTIGTILGAVGMRKVYQKYPGKILKNHNLPKGFVDEKSAMRGATKMTMEGKVLPVARKIAKLSDADRQKLHAIITEFADGPAALKKLGAEASQVVSQLGKQLVEAGVMDERTWLKNKDKYLHRLYTKHNSADAAAQMGGASMIATEMMSRGHKLEVPIADWRAGKYNGKGYEEWTPGDFDTSSTFGRWRKKRAKYIKAHDKELQDLYKAKYARYEAEEGRKLTDAEKKRARKVVKDDFLPSVHRAANAPEFKITIRRDWTKQERKDMGEITDAYDTFLATGKILAHDAATARMMKHVKDNFSSKTSTLKNNVQMPKNKKKYGVLSEQFVSKEIRDDLMNFAGDAGINKAMSGKIGRTYRAFNSWWKGTKTVGNPATHANNFVSNIMMYDMGVTNMGVKKWALLASAMRDVTIFGKGKRHQKILADDKHPLNIAMRHGLLSSNMVNAELRGEGFRDIMRIINQEAGVLRANPDASKLVKLALNSTRKIWEKTGGLGTKAAGDLYSWEDNIFRYAIWKAEWTKLKDAGIDSEKAAAIAARKGRDWFVDYENVPPALAWLREMPLPFASYTYGIVPRLMESAVRNPMKIAKWAAVAAIANEAGWTMSDDSDREEIERLMEAQSIGNDTMYGIPGAPSTNIKIPDAINPFQKQGDLGFWNIERMLPANVFDQREGGVGQISILPGFAQPGFGAAGSIAYTAMGVDQFKGTPIPEGEKLDALYKQWVPNIPGLPGTYADTKITRAASGKNETADNHTMFSAVASAFGLKLTPVDLDKLSGRVMSKFKAEEQSIKSKYRQNELAFANGTYGEERYEERKVELEKKLENFLIRATRTMDGD